MSNCSAKRVAALFAGIVAGANLAAVTEIRAQTADSCLSSPKGATPASSHWYYRIDRATKRQCWYLREEDDKPARVAPQASSPAQAPSAGQAKAAEAAPQQPPTITQKSIADARAQWVSQQNRAEQNPTANAAPQASAAVPAPNVSDNTRALAANVLAPTPFAATRWIDPSSANVASTPADLRTAAVAAPAPADPAADQIRVAEQSQQPAMQQPAPVVPLAAADTAKPTASLQMLLLVMAAALGLAGIIVSLVFRVGRLRAKRAMRRKRNAMWDSARARARTKRQPPPSVVPGVEAPRRRRAEAVHSRGAPEERERQQVNEMLARLARSAQH